MKKIVLIICAVLLAVTVADAQDAKKIRKERAEISRLSKAELNEKVLKEARKEARRLERDGWKVAPGALPIARQLDRSYKMQHEYDENLFPKYIMGNAISIGENYDAAKMQALELAKQNLAGQIHTEVTELIENTVANRQLAEEAATSITQSLAASKNLIFQSIGRVIPVVEMYCTKPNKNKEVSVYIAYSGEMAKAAAKDAIRKDLESKGDELHGKLDELLGW